MPNERALAVDEPVEEGRGRHVARDPVLVDEVDAHGRAGAKDALGLGSGVDERSLGAEVAPVQLRVGRLEEGVGELLVRQLGEVVEPTQADGSRPRDPETIGQCAEALLVDELLDDGARREARRKSLAKPLRQASGRERPVVAARNEHGAFQSKRFEVLGKDAAVVGLRQPALGRAVPARSNDDVVRLVHDGARHTAGREPAEDAERGDVRPEDEDRCG